MTKEATPAMRQLGFIVFISDKLEKMKNQFVTLQAKMSKQQKP
jgi:hypothetical protein